MGTQNITTPVEEIAVLQYSNNQRVDSSSHSFFKLLANQRMKAVGILLFFLFWVSFHAYNFSATYSVVILSTEETRDRENLSSNFFLLERVRTNNVTSKWRQSQTEISVLRLVSVSEKCWYTTEQRAASKEKHTLLKGHSNSRHSLNF